MTETNKPNIPSKQEMAEELQSKAQAASREVKEKSDEQLQEYGSQAASSMESVAEAAQRAADSLGEHNQTMLSNYVSELANGISGLASSLRDKNTDEILRDVGRLARENAGLFLLGSVAIGFGLARIAKAGGGWHEAEESEDWKSFYGVGAAGYEGEEESSRYQGQPSSGQSSFSETDAQAQRSPQPQTHADTSYLPEEGGGTSGQQSTASSALSGSQKKPPSGGNAERRI